MATNKVTAKRNRIMSLSTPSATDAKRAEALAVEYRAAGICSNRQEWERLAVILACYFVAERGEYCALPSIDGKSPVYNRAWRAVRSALSEEQWECIKVTAVHNGRFTTTAKQGTAYIVPADTITKGDAPQGW